MSPHVGAVVADENCDIADNANAALAAIGTQSRPLLEERELQEALLVELLAQLSVQFGHGIGAPANDFLRPAIPGLIAVAFPQATKQHIIFQPPMIVAAEAVVALPRHTRRRPQEVPARLPQEGKLVLAHAVKINRRIRVGRRPDPLTIDEGTLGETFR